MQHLKEYISESILSSVGAGKIAIIKKIVSDKDFTLQNIALLEKSVSVWKPKDKKELTDMITAYIEYAGPKCSLNWIDVSSITDIGHIFNNSKFNGDISKWDVSNVESMYGIFNKSTFNGDISKWDISNAKVMTSMFANSKFTQDLSNWVIDKTCKTMFMFVGCKISKDHMPIFK